jgi:hypothetical protein
MNSTLQPSLNTQTSDPLKEKVVYVQCENPEEEGSDKINPRWPQIFPQISSHEIQTAWEELVDEVGKEEIVGGAGDDGGDGNGPWRQGYPAFSVWPSSMLSKPIYNMCNAVTKHNLWEWMRDEDPPADQGYSWWRHPNLRKIDSDDAVNNDGHSGCSFACSMRGVQFIAKHGYEAWASEVIGRS